MNYQKEYDSIINNRKLNLIKENNNINDYTEVHHIKPRSFFKYGTSNEVINHPDNLVRLTGEEHFLAHYYLYHCYEEHTKERIASLEGFKAMGMENTSHDDRFFNAKLYQEGKEDLIKEYEYKSLEDIKLICEFKDEYNKNPNKRSSDKDERRLGIKLGRLKTNKRNKELGKDYINFFLDSYQELSIDLGYENLFKIKNLEEDGLTKVNEICEWIKTNDKEPSVKSTDEVEKTLGHKLGNIRQNKKNEIAFYDSYQTLAESYGFNDLFRLYDKDNINETNIKNLCLFINENKRTPSRIKGNRTTEQEIENSLSVFHFNMTDGKKGKSTYEFIESYDELAEELGYKYLFDGVKVFNFIIKINNLCDWWTINKRKPIKKDGKIHTLFYNLKRKKKDKSWVEIYDDILDSYNLSNILD